jgi:hypothetical protein
MMDTHREAPEEKPLPLLSVANDFGQRRSHQIASSIPDRPDEAAC